MIFKGEVVMLFQNAADAARQSPTPSSLRELVDAESNFSQFSNLSPSVRAALILKDSALASLVEQDLKRALITLALPEDLASSILKALSSQSGGVEETRKIVAPYRDSFYWHFKGRSERLACSLKDALVNASNNTVASRELFDWGTGDTQVAKRIQELVPYFQVSGGDILPYYQGEPAVKFCIIKNNLVPQIEDNSQAVVTLSYVLHHESDSLKILQEISRMLCNRGRAIIVELIPCGDNLSQRNIDTQRLWFSDFLFCDVWHKQDGIPMPGNYRTVADWEKQACKAGLSLIEEKSIAGTPVIYADALNGRKLMVFEKSL